ncbi:hypothetical protein HPB48_010127 [Haemaphysalis longicornis]|uniref:Uncharacterized protein n=1 Tax=Haemaphysalis longicornis TaxID=44386 RepID=A0A9J6GDD9_HAELO|nr:hypothetical protein HPB48_010127 [Haemaphysalis longicornis]
MHRLALTPTGRKILQRLGRTVPFEHPSVQPVPAFLQAVIEAPPLPKNMQAGSQDGRRRARTRHARFFVSVQTSDLQDLPECASEDAIKRQKVLNQRASKETPLGGHEYVNIGRDIATYPGNTAERIGAEVWDKEKDVEDEPQDESEEIATVEDTTLLGAQSDMKYLRIFFFQKEPG